MPGKSRIQWHQRIQVFLDYRHLHKVYPVARSHGIARSTVDAIVVEFMEAWFSRQPRLSISPDTLEQIQDHHVLQVINGVKAPHTVHLIGPSDNLRGGLDPEDALGERADFNVTQKDPLRLSEELVWHLKGTKAESVIDEVRRSAQTYDAKCLELWLNISRALSNASNLPVRPYQAPEERWEKAHIFHTLVDNVYQELYKAAGGPGKPNRGWPNWSPTGDPAVLRCGDTDCVIGAPAEQKHVQDGVESFVLGDFHTYVRQAKDIDLLYRDLQYLQGILEEALSQVSEQSVRGSICPSCPYPEAVRQHGLV